MNSITSQKYIQFKHLYIAPNENDAVFLGYKFHLTKTEYQILKVLIQNINSTLSAEEIAIQTGLNLSKENVVFHISGINKKAKSISNRILIKNITKNGYFLNEKM